MEPTPSNRARLEFAGSVVLGSLVCFLSSASAALFLMAARKWGRDDLAVALRWSALLSVMLLLILAAWRKVAFRLPPLPRVVVGVGTGMLIVVSWALFAREQYGRLWPLYGAPLLPCWLVGAPAGFLVASRPRLRPDFPFVALLAGIAIWTIVVASVFWPSR